MTNERYKILDQTDAELTEEEIKEGWKFCADCDYLLTNDCCLDRIKRNDKIEEQIEF